MTDQFLTPQVVAALAGLGGVLLGSLISWGVQGHLLGRRIRADESLAERKFGYDRGLAERKFEFDKLLSAQKLEADTALAEKKAGLDRAFATWRRRSELAEQAMIRFNEVQKVLMWVRNRGILGSEGESRVSESAEDERLKRQRNTYFIPIERLQREKELFSALQTLRPMFEAHFGAQAAKPFDEVTSIYTEIVVAVDTLIQMAEFSVPSPAFAVGQSPSAPLLNILGWGPGPRPDGIDHRIDAAVAEIRAICDPVLAWKPEE